LGYDFSETYASGAAENLRGFLDRCLRKGFTPE
jgi:hypothetical protein